jgi:DNA mismatch endonuclease, patch repair protein
MDNLTKEQRKKNMQNIKSSHTLPERIVARELRKKKIYFVQNVKDIVGNPDIVFKRKKIIIFIDSDFWHGHNKRFIMPKTNKKYWIKKITNNKERDRKVNKLLKINGWVVIRIWEYDIKNNLEKSLKKILTAIGKKETL